ncbi:MAG: SUMF1/EgtB/PvdO family nonheme iron enzyme, partial [Polyangia bacterium]
GNVAEWTWNWWGVDFSQEVQDPLGPTEGDARVSRGGSWLYIVETSRSAARYLQSPENAHPFRGLRPVRTLP